MVHAQGSLEYLIIIAAVLSISAIVVLYMAGIVGQQSQLGSISSCKQASESCRLARMSAPNDPCLDCISACIDPSTSKEVFNGAIYCCNHTQSNLIYINSPGCGGGYTYGPRTDIYFDPFNNLNGWRGDLSASCTNTGGWCINTGYIGSAAYMDSHGAYTITHTQSTVGYKDIQVSFYALTCGDAGGSQIVREYLKVEWYDGSVWTTLLDVNSITPWTLESYTLPASANENPNFAVRITAYDSHDSGSFCMFAPFGRKDLSQVDEFKITGLPRI